MSVVEFHRRPVELPDDHVTVTLADCVVAGGSAHVYKSYSSTKQVIAEENERLAVFGPNEATKGETDPMKQEAISESQAIHKILTQAKLNIMNHKCQQLLA